MGADFLNHPGNLGAHRGTLLTIHHADWPAYPQGDDFASPLVQLTTFPATTEFMVIDNIDRSVLLVACVHGAKLDDALAARNFHIALWYEDLIELDKRGLLEGITRTTERAWHEERWRKLISEVPAGAQVGFKSADGTFVPIEEPDFASYSDEPEYAEFVVFNNDRLKVTAAGRHFVSQELGNLKTEIMNSLGSRVADIFERGYYDTCVREACVQLEHEIRVRAGVDAFGDRLVELFIEQIRSEKRHLESYLRTLRQELRAVFKFIRNDFMHNLREADVASSLALLVRIARVRTLLHSPAEQPTMPNEAPRKDPTSNDSEGT